MCTSTSTSTTSPRRSTHLIQLGATRLGDFDEEGYHWITLADPEGNEFDVVERTAA